MNKESIVQNHILFKGYVQGVGFRFTAVRIAQKYGLVGWVRNNPDGAVEIVSEGEREKLDSFVDDLKGAFDRYIKDYSREESSAAGRFKEFKISY